MSLHTQETAVPATLDSPRAKLVYLALATGGEATAAELHDRLAIPKLAVFSILKSLRRQGLVEREDGRYRTA